MVGAVLASALNQQPLFVITKLKWDETGQKVTTQHAGMSAEQQRSTWHVLVCRMTIAISWVAWAGTLAFSVAFPPLLVANTKSETIWSAIFRHPLYMPLFTAIEKLFSLAGYAVDLNETDAAYSNERLMAGRMMRSIRPVLIQWSPCGNHQTQIVETNVLNVASLSLLSRLYSVSLFLKAENHFKRLVHAAQQCVQKDSLLIVKPMRVHGQPPGLASHFNREAVHFVVSHYRRFEASMQQAGGGGDEADMGGMGSDDDDIFDDQGELDESRVRDRGVRQMIRHGRDFLKIFNGEWWVPGQLATVGEEGNHLHQATRASRATDDPERQQVDEACEVHRRLVLGHDLRQLHRLLLPQGHGGLGLRHGQHGRQQGRGVGCAVGARLVVFRGQGQAVPGLQEILRGSPEARADSADGSVARGHPVSLGLVHAKGPRDGPILFFSFRAAVAGHGVGELLAGPVRLAVPRDVADGRLRCAALARVGFRGVPEPSTMACQSTPRSASFPALVLVARSTAPQAAPRLLHAVAMETDGIGRQQTLKGEAC
eukprot:11167851-Lingulodinium_polyedra.AAC.1